MNRHQILTGAVNSGDECHAVGSVADIQFTAYATGCDIVILASNFQRIQIIPGAAYGNVQIGCIDCCNYTGKIAASYGPTVFIFQPSLLKKQTNHRLDYVWHLIGTIVTVEDVHTLAFNENGSSILTGGDVIQMWKSPVDVTSDDITYTGKSNFEVGGDSEESTLVKWDCIWQRRTASPVCHIKFSPDGHLFCTIGKNERVVKIWYESANKEHLHLSQSNSVISPPKSLHDFTFIYVAHPRAVTGFSWRKTSPYMPKGCVANVLLTSCKDNICRIWCETVLPDDDRSDLQWDDGNSCLNHILPVNRSQIIQTKDHIRTAVCSNHRLSEVNHVSLKEPIPDQFISVKNMHQVHKTINIGGLETTLRFHLAASINPETDIPLLPTIGNYENSAFVVHWMNNKELQFTSEAQIIIRDIDSHPGEAHEKFSKQDSNRSGTNKHSTLDEEDGLWENGGQPFMKDDEEEEENLNKIGDSSWEVEKNKAELDESALERLIEKLLCDWYQDADVVFMVHPVDGSFLVWLIEYLDELRPNSFRQAQVNFSSRIPHCFPVGDANTMSTNIILFSTQNAKSSPCNQNVHYKKNETSSGLEVHVISNHSNGSLNLWHLTFAENSKFSVVLNVSHSSRACGHRFRTNQAACHPVLPLLITSSHHNLPKFDEDCHLPRSQSMSAWCEAAGFCSELILWKVESVGPLSQSGGITEISRINSSHISAFSDVAWIPTLLPSSILGSLSNSPSALFIASDGKSLRIYQAVVDARTILNEMNHNKHMMPTCSLDDSMEIDEVVYRTRLSACESLKIASLQSTARPGCILELDSIEDAYQDWQNTQFLHIYQGQMISNKKSTAYTSVDAGHKEAVVDLRNITVFEEHFYLVVIEKRDSRTFVHMWRIVISSKPECFGDLEYHHSGDEQDATFMHQKRGRWRTGEDVMKFSIETHKVYTQLLDLPTQVEVITSAVSAGHMSSSSIYPACYAPYLFCTTCSDSTVRFWKCDHIRMDSDCDEIYDWHEWRMMIPPYDCSSIQLPGTPIALSCAYSGRIAVAHRSGCIRTDNPQSDKKYVNLVVSIYECESTGGSEWTLEDTINLKDIAIPDPKAEINLNLTTEVSATSDLSPNKSRINYSMSIPSLSTIYTIRHLICDEGNEGGRLTQKQLTQLDWISTEDGSHILTVGVGSQVLMFAPISTEIDLSSKEDTGGKDKLTNNPRPLLQKTKSMTVPAMVDEIRWMRLRSIELCSADGLPSLPMHVSWVRDGILVVGMDSEMHVYTQWRETGEEWEKLNDERFKEHENQRIMLDINRVASGSNLTLKHHSSLLKKSHSSGSLKKMNELKSPNNLTCDTDTENVSNLQFIQYCGLFEAARLSNPVLPQYHPRQLLELLNFGKIRRVKAILAHLTRCVTGSQRCKDNVQSRTTRRMSFSAPIAEANTLQEEVLDYVEINAIPPLPLYALLAADQDTMTNQDTASSPFSVDNDSDLYSALFATAQPTQECQDEENDGNTKRRTSSTSPARKNPNYFGPGQCRMLASHLTYTHLPGLSRLDQMYLLALADTVSNTSVNLSDRFAPDLPVKSHSIDDCGLRYMLAMRHYIYLKRTLPMRQRAKIQSTGLGSAYIVWAFHSEVEEELLSYIPSMRKGEATWNELRQFGCGWWIRNNHLLRRTIEKIAKAAFRAHKDPMDAALFYLAQKKKNLLRGLFRSVSDNRMSEFLSHDFTEDRWRRAALKNAFALLGKQRFEHAAAFFLLAGALRDAIDVCLRKLEDIQLAIVLASLYESELDETLPPNLVRILNEEILGREPDANTDYTKQSPDPFLRSMAYWIQKEYGNSLSTLVDFEAGASCKNNYAIGSCSTGPTVFNFYTYLRTHPLFRRRDIATAAQDNGKTVLIAGFTHGKSLPLDRNVMITDKITPLERRLFFTTSHAHLKAGCPQLALEVLSQLPEMLDQDTLVTNKSGCKVVVKPTRPKMSVEGPTKRKSIGWAEPTIKWDKSEIDWSKPLYTDTSDFELESKLRDSDKDGQKEIVLKTDNAEHDEMISKKKKVPTATLR